MQPASLARRLRTLGRHLRVVGSLSATPATALRLLTWFLCARSRIPAWRSRTPRDVRVRLHGEPLTLRMRPVDYYILYEVWGLEVYRSLVETVGARHGVVLDLGGHIGLASLYVAICCPAAQVLAVEPELDNLALLTINASRVGRITPVGVAVGPTSGWALLARQPDRPSNHRLVEGEEHDDAQPVLVVHADQLVELAGPILGAKLDVEGLEEAILASSAGLAEAEIVVTELRAPSRGDVAEALARCLPGHDSEVTTVARDIHIAVARPRAQRDAQR